MPVHPCALSAGHGLSNITWGIGDMQNQLIWNDPEYLKAQQYKTDANLLARQLLHQKFSTGPVNWFHWLFDLAPYPAGGRILDAGCGNGLFWQANASPELPLDAHLTLLDLSRGMLESAVIATGGRLKTVLAVEGSAMQMPFPNAFFNCIFANHMLYHVSAPEQAIAEFARLLHPAGTLLVALNGPRHMRELWLLMADLLGIEIPTTEKLFSPDQAELALQKYFSYVTRHSFVDALKVTDGAILWDYILSMAGDLVPEQILDRVKVKFEAIFEGAVEAQGHFYIQKDAVAFECVK